VREVVVAALALCQATIYLFGSHARGTAPRRSDVDVAIDTTAPLPRGVMARLRGALEESTIPYPVDLLDLRGATEDIRDDIEREGVIWSNPGAG
jgi:predicted nucleotidyltransferase